VRLISAVDAMDEFEIENPAAEATCGGSGCQHYALVCNAQGSFIKAVTGCCMTCC
jgi:hypothetical protein